MVNLILGLILSLFPSFLGVPLRRVLGFSLGNGTKISFGALIFSKDVKIGDNAIIGSFTYIKASKIRIGNNSLIKPFVIISTNTFILGNIVQISPLVLIVGNQLNKSILKVGDRTSILPFCWLEPGEGIEIGNNVGIGGHTLIFTHGVWSNYLKGGPVTYGRVVIKDNVWLAWRTFIMPGVTIEKNSIVSANSFVVRDVPKNITVSGNPARGMTEAHKLLNSKDLEERFVEILHDFKKYFKEEFKLDSNIYDDRISFSNFKIVFKDFNKHELESNDLVFILHEKDLKFFQNSSISLINLYNEEAYLNMCSNTNLHQEFISFLRRYGIRIFTHI